MSIEVRQLLIRSQITPAVPPAPAAIPPRELQRLREQLLAECRTWLIERLRTQQER
ncbi:DUF5908 family protein [Roseateles cellulosilyticus]|uniref:DUF5908 family protein n=1 Tax=Pelomonas cellulosilytica TaxID=2906762 RepID=A0ABS8XUC1_9BURK|nr:DUF5908 family protein [Pelomonas sp. P8]MCE4554323.1 DUF5908 family protein [Pelomonas sp. P8]